MLNEAAVVVVVVNEEMQILDETVPLDTLLLDPELVDLLGILAVLLAVDHQKILAVLSAVDFETAVDLTAFDLAVEYCLVELFSGPGLHFQGRELDPLLLKLC